MSENKTKPTEIAPSDYVAHLENADRRADSLLLIKLMTRLSGHSPKMWGPTIIGFGTYHYKYESGREGDSFEAGFAPRKNEMVVYLGGEIATQSELLEKLGKHRMGKACLYIKKLTNVDMEILEELVRLSILGIRTKYPKDAK